MTTPLRPDSAAPTEVETAREQRRRTIREGLSPAGVATQVAVFGVCALAMVSVLAISGSWAWAVMAPLALAIGIGIGLAAIDDLGPWLLTVRTIPVALVVVMVLATLVVIVAPSSEGAPFGVVLLVGIAVLGLEWQWAERLRPIVFLAGLVVVAAVAAGEPWAPVVVVIWLLAAAGSLSLIEQDRRRARPPVQPLGHAPTRPAPRGNDLASMVVVAAALAVLAALILSTPSCNPNLDSNRTEFSEGEPGGNGGPTGTEPGGSPTQYVPDPDGNFLIPDDGSGGSEDRLPIPNFENPPALGPDGEATVTDRDGTTLTYRESPDGSLEVEVDRPDGSSETWQFDERSDGLTRIDRFDEDGNLEDTYFYDPDGVLFDGSASDSESFPGSTPEPEPEPEADREVNWGLLALVALAIVAGTALVLWLLNRKTQPPVDPMAPTIPPWAVQLVRSIEEAGAERGLPRHTGQSIVEYTGALRAGPLPDPAIVAIGELVSQALFSHRPPSELAGEEAARRLETLRAAHPTEDRPSRFSRSGAAR